MVERFHGVASTDDVVFEYGAFPQGALDGEVDITPAYRVDDEAEPGFDEGVLFKMCIDAERQISVEEVGRGVVNPTMLDHTCIMMLDTRTEIFLWSGEETSELERRNALKTCCNYLRMNGRDIHNTAIHVLKTSDGTRNKTW